MQALQVLEQNNEFYLDSREVAEMLGKRHDHLIRDIKGYVKVLEDNPKLGSRKFFVESIYINSQNKSQPCYLLTKKGCDMVGNKMTGAKGTLFTAMYVDAFHEMDERIKQAQLNIPNTPMEALELFFAQHKEQQAINEQMKREIKGIREVITIDFNNWRNETNRILNAIANKLNIPDGHHTVRKQAYKALEQKGHCKLNIRLENKKKKMAQNGANKSRINKLSKLDVINDEPRLIEIYISIIKNMAIKHSVDIEKLNISERAL
ncbi:Rha family transcriptional regulator [Staphylococcus xylosus]